MVSAPSYLLHSQEQVYKLIGKCPTHGRLVKRTLTFPASEADGRIGSQRERENKRNREETIDGRDRNDTAKNETKGRRRSGGRSDRTRGADRDGDKRGGVGDCGDDGRAHRYNMNETNGN